MERNNKCQNRNNMGSKETAVTLFADKKKLISQRINVFSNRMGDTPKIEGFWVSYGQRQQKTRLKIENSTKTTWKLPLYCEGPACFFVVFRVDSLLVFVLSTHFLNIYAQVTLDQKTTTAFRAPMKQYC